ncbi:MAG: O-antigen ligase family protein [Saprospiraceae bacterium]|nr:O-antigen ligase family protein [Saprospiraceae bacterium]
MAKFLIRPGLLKDVFTQGLSYWLSAAMALLVLNFGISYILYYDAYKDYITDIFSSSLTSYALLFSFMILLSNESNFRFVSKVFPFAVLFGALNNFYDITNFSDDYGFGLDFRAAGNYLNPNASAQVLLMGMVLVIFRIPPKWRFLFFLVMALGVFLTLSRGAAPILAVLFMLIAFWGSFNLKNIVIGFAVAVTTLVLLFGSFKTTQSYTRMIEYLKYNNGIEKRLNQIIHPQETHVGIRATVFREHYYYYLRSPLLGNGLSSSKYIEREHSSSGHSSHVMYLHILNEYGILGLGLLLGLPLSFLYNRGKWLLRKEAILFGIVFLLAGIQSHNLFDSYSMLFCYAYMAALINFKE